MTLPAEVLPVTPVTPRYAVVVATRNRGERIVPLLESVQANECRDFEMVIVDQSTSDVTRRAVEPFLGDPRVRYVYSSVPGASRARNLGIYLTTAPIIVITDDDCIVPKHWLSGIARPFEDNPRVGVVFCSVDPAPSTEPGHTPQIRFAESRTVSSLRTVWKNDYLSLGAGMAIRRAALADVVGFDELLGPGAVFQAAEDNDLAWRALVNGWSVYENADVSVLHDGFRSLDELRELVKRDFYGVGGTIAKYLKAGHWQISSLLFSWVFRFGVVEPARDLMARRYPRGFRRPYMLLRGLVDGLRTPLDAQTIRYRKREGSL
jgi:GT2 family glycosyltransferase